MRQLLAAIVLGGILATTVPAAFALQGDNHITPGTPAFGPVTLDTGTDDAGVAGANTQEHTWEYYDRLQNRGK